MRSQPAAAAVPVTAHDLSAVRLVVIHSAQGTVAPVEEGQVVDGGALLPGLALAVSDVD